MSGRVVQYGRRSKHRVNPSPSPEPSPKRQKVHDTLDIKQISYDAQARSRPRNDLSQTPARSYISKAKLVDNNDESIVHTRPNSPVNSGAAIPMPSSTTPKDLSEIFAPLPKLPASPSPSSGKSIAKRMLVRSHTEPTLTPSVSPKTTITAATSLPTIPSGSPQRDETCSSPGSSRPNVRTYSQSRSFLVALPVASNSRLILAEDHCLDRSTVSPGDDLRESYSDLRMRWGVDNSEDDPYTTPGITNELMSVTELRSKGESRRFLDEVGYLFEGLEEHGMSSSVKRSSALEIVLKMCDAEFVRKAKAADFIGRAWDAMRLAGAGDGDKVLDPCLAFFVALVVRNRHDADDLVRRETFFMTMMRLLGTETDIDGLRLLEVPTPRQMKISKSERVALADLRKIVMTKSDLFTSSSVLSIRLLASFSLSCLIHVPLPGQLVSPLLTTLLAELALIHPQSDGHQSKILPSPAVCDLEHIDFCLKILDSFLVGDQGREFVQDNLKNDQEVLVKGLVSLCVEATTLYSEGEAGRKCVARRCIESSFRVLINLSHTSSEWCKLLLRDPLTLPTIIPQIIFCDLLKCEDAHTATEEYDEETRALDRQCLALGLLSNIVFAAKEARDSIRDIQIDPSCPRGSCCVPACNCIRRSSAIECLVHLFVKTGTKTESASINDLDFFRCHLAALLSLLTVDNPTNQHIVRQLLPEEARKTFGDSVRQFLDIYAYFRGNRKETSEDTMASCVMLALQALET